MEATSLEKWASTNQYPEAKTPVGCWLVLAQVVLLAMWPSGLAAQAWQRLTTSNSEKLPLFSDGQKEIADESIQIEPSRNGRHSSPALKKTPDIFNLSFLRIPIIYDHHLKGRLAYLAAYHRGMPDDSWLCSACSKHG